MRNNILPMRPVQLRLVWDAERDLDAERRRDMSRDEYASLMTALRGRFVDSEDPYGPGAA